jgi:hypothetical protein
MIVQGKVVMTRGNKINPTLNFSSTVCGVVIKQLQRVTKDRVSPSIRIKL